MRKMKKKAGRDAPTGRHAKDRHRKDRRGIIHDWSGPLPEGLVAKPHVAQPKSRHHSYFELVDNKDKKKKLEFQVTTNREPPPGFEFVPIGNPALTTACKELSRERDAMIFIVSTAKGGDAKELSLALNRIGHHIRQTIVEQARESLGVLESAQLRGDAGAPEPIPASQEKINEQADAAIRDLFPRIPNVDRQIIIERAFKKGAKMHGAPLVGLAADITLSRRVQLAVIAHIRHCHTRYDQLLRETSYVNARKAVESLCLDILVKWRGDEETGRDQLDEILREVVVISDSEDGEEEDTSDEDEESESTDASSVQELFVARDPVQAAASAGLRRPLEWASSPAAANALYIDDAVIRVPGTRISPRTQKVDKLEAKKARRGFLRYQAVRDQAWHDAVERQRLGANEPALPAQAASRGPIGGPDSYGYDAYSTRMPYRATASSLRNENPRVPVAPHHQRLPMDGCADRYQTARGYQSVTGPYNNTYEPLPGPRAVVSNQRQDFKDYPVRSIEPTSPDSYDFPYHIPAPHSEERRYAAYLPVTPAALVDRSGVPEPTRDHRDQHVLSSRHTGDDQRRLVRVRAGGERVGVPRSPVSYSAPRPLQPYTRVIDPAYPVARTLNVAQQRHPAPHHRVSAMAEDHGSRRQRSHPIVVEDYEMGGAAVRGQSSRYLLAEGDGLRYGTINYGAVVREEPRPAALHNYGARPERDQVYARQPVTAPGEHQGASWAGSRQRPPGQPATQWSTYTGSPLGGTPTEFIPVANRFPQPLAPPSTLEDGLWLPSERRMTNARYPDEPADPWPRHGRGREPPRNQAGERVEYVHHVYRDRDYESRTQSDQRERMVRRDMRPPSVPFVGENRQAVGGNRQAAPETRSSGRGGVIYMT